jgi:hypothetical protein
MRKTQTASFGLEGNFSKARCAVVSHSPIAKAINLQLQVDPLALACE